MSNKNFLDEIFKSKKKKKSPLEKFIDIDNNEDEKESSNNKEIGSNVDIEHYGTSQTSSPKENTEVLTRGEQPQMKTSVSPSFSISDLIKSIPSVLHKKECFLQILTLASELTDSIKASTSMLSPILHPEQIYTAVFFILKSNLPQIHRLFFYKLLSVDCIFN